VTERIDRTGLPPGAIGVMVGEPDPEKRCLLAEAYRRVQVPPELAPPLVSSPAQIEACRQYERKVGMIASGEFEDENGTPVLPLWEVTLETTATKVVMVRGIDADDAEAQAEAGDYEQDGEWDVDGDIEEVGDIRMLRD